MACYKIYNLSKLTVPTSLKSYRAKLQVKSNDFTPFILIVYDSLSSGQEHKKYRAPPPPPDISLN